MTRTSARMNADQTELMVSIRAFAASRSASSAFPPSSTRPYRRSYSVTRVQDRLSIPTTAQPVNIPSR